MSLCIYLYQHDNKTCILYLYMVHYEFFCNTPTSLNIQ